MSNQPFKKSEILSYLEYLNKKEAFSEEEYPTIDAIVSAMGAAARNNILTKNEIQEINSSFGDEFLNDTLQGMALLKPFGYAGDFLIIDKIYTYHLSENPYHKSWDKYFQNMAAVQAVRNRKEYFKKLIKINLKNRASLQLLNVASGPARDLQEVYAELNPNEKIETTCIEMDENAIRYAKELNKDFLDNIDFVNKNIFKYNNENKYDMIWSAGLFDYFDDRTFVIILKRFKKWINSKGEIIIGNFNLNYNLSRECMEIMCEWYLNYRDEEQLIELAKKAGFEQEQITIGREEQNINLFLHIKIN